MKPFSSSSPLFITTRVFVTSDPSAGLQDKVKFPSSILLSWNYDHFKSFKSVTTTFLSNGAKFIIYNLICDYWEL